jgi:hypothetical protein
MDCAWLQWQMIVRVAHWDREGGACRRDVLCCCGVQRVNETSIKGLSVANAYQHTACRWQAAQTWLDMLPTQCPPRRGSWVSPNE